MQIFPTRRAFTLIELLVVIAIISLLAAILFPVFGRARENARRSSCSSNLRQIGMGMMQYVQDFDETYPVHWWNDVAARWEPENIKTYWESAVFPYVRSSQMFNCPSQPKTTRATFPMDYTKPTVMNGTTTYIKNYFIMNADGYASARPVRLSLVQRPAEIIAFGEMNVRNQAVMNDDFKHVWDPSSNRIRQGFPHFDGSNYLFCDGHVKWMQQSRAGVDTDESAKLWGRIDRTKTNKDPVNFLYGQ